MNFIQQQHNDTETTELSDRLFDPWRIPKTRKAEAAVTEVINRLLLYEQHFELRQRQRKSQDQKIFEIMVTAIACDLMHTHIIDPSMRTALPLSNQYLGTKYRYRSPTYSKTLPNILKNMTTPEMNFVELVKGSRQITMVDDKFQYQGRQSTIKAAPALIRRIEENKVTLDDFGRSQDEEVIILKAEKKAHYDSGEWIEYEDTPETNKFRSDLKVINSWLEDADIAILGDDHIDTGDKRLRRIFNNGSFTQGGRLFGGFWQSISRAKRQNCILIDGEFVAELDYNQMALRMLYGIAGEPLPTMDDLYSIPGLELYRDGVKKLINSALYSDKKQSSMPKGTRQLFPDHISYADAMDLINKAHAPVTGQFFKGVGMELMYRESQVMVNVLLRLKDMGIIALPIHDGILVDREFCERAKSVMEDTLKDHFGWTSNDSLGSLVTVEGEEI